MPEYEHNHQVAFFRWVAEQGQADWRYWAIYAVPNGGRSTPHAKSYLIQEGLQRGVPDVVVAVPVLAPADYGFGLPVGPCKVVAGLYVELKSPTRSKQKDAVSDDQLAWLDLLYRLGYQVEVAFGFEQLKALVQNYLRMGDSDAY